MANHYLIWVDKYGKDEADKREMARRDKLRAISLRKAALNPKKEVVKKEKKPRTGKNNGMYGKTVLEVWSEKYGKEIAEQKWKEFCDNRAAKLRVTRNLMSSDERKKIFGNPGLKNGMCGKSYIDVWTEKYGEEEANSRILAKRKKMREDTVRSERMKGDKNPSKRLGASERISKHRKEYYSNPENRKKASECMSKIHEEGRGGSGYTKNYKYTINGKEYIVQGSYELAFIKWLDINKMKFRCHEDRIKYIDSNGIERIYLPDFFVEDWNSYVDVKSSYWYSIQIDKFNAIYQSNPNLQLKILLEADLVQMNILK